MVETNKSISRWAALTVLCSALLLFQIQPMASKAILAWFGGATSVWTTSMLFFQTTLVFGYCYAHWLSRWPLHRQIKCHLVVVLTAFIFLPLSFTAPDATTTAEQPASTILLLLFTTLGLPYFVLSSTGPLIQNWYALTQGDGTPYRLYSLSNIGSLTALISYPFLMEVYLDIPTQAWLWSAGYVIFAASMSILGWTCLRQQIDIKTESEHPQPAIQSPPTWKRMLHWSGLAALASSLLLAVTDQLTQDIAVTPFLWILPLALYLISFIITFDNPRWYYRVTMAALTSSGILILSLYYIRETADQYLGTAFFQSLAESLIGYTIMLTAVFFMICMTCHGELFRLRPHKQHLTVYYVCIAIGGAAGGFFVSIVCPLIFTHYHEYHFGLIAGFSFSSLILVRHVLDQSSLKQLAVVIPCGLAFGIVVLSQWKMTQNNALEASRNFYGTLQVERTETNSNLLKLRHGRVVHGIQILDDSGAMKPTAYYGTNSGIGQVFKALEHRADLDITGVGLGVGTLSSYARRGDVLRFYEINPDVIAISNKYFRFIEKASTNVQITAIDGRLGIQSLQSKSTDLIILDAFSSDAIPVHLLTLEAFAIYLDRLREDGIICVHISNQHLDLTPVLHAVCKHYNLDLRIINSKETADTFDAQWAVITANSDVSSTIDQSTSAITPTITKPVAAWTDHFSNLLQIIK